LRRIGRAGLLFAESVCGRCEMSQQAVKRTLGNGVTRERAREIEVEALGRLRRPRRTVLAESA